MRELDIELEVTRARQLEADGWQKPVRSGAGGQCEYVRKLPTGNVQVTNSSDPREVVIEYTEGEWRARHDAHLTGQFDYDNL